MIYTVHGDIFYSPAEAVVNPVNCVGVAGKGLALQFKKEYSMNFRLYKELCDIGGLTIGSVHATETGRTLPKYILNFPTKRHWKDKSRLEDIVLGLKGLLEVIMDLNIRSVAIPPIGCGLGGLNWVDVKAKIENLFSAPVYSKLVDVYLHEPIEVAAT